MISCNIWLPVVIHRSKTRNNALDVFWGMETIIVNLAFSWVLVKLQFQLMKVKNISPKLSARANYTFSGMTILQHEPAAAPKKVFLPCVSLPRANFYENIFYNAFALFYLKTNEFFYHESVIFIYKNRKNYFAALITFQNAFVVLKLLKIKGYFVSL